MDFSTLIKLLVKEPKTPDEVQVCLKELYVKYGNPLIVVGKKMLESREREVAEDVAINIMLDTLTKAINNIRIGQIHSESHLKNWLYLVFKNDILMYLRGLPENMFWTSLSNSECSDEEDENDSQYKAGDPDLYNIVDEINDHLTQDINSESMIEENVWDLLDVLKDEEKTLVILKIKDNLSYKEIASRLNTNNIPLLRKQYQRAIEKLKQIHATPVTIILKQ